jgi:hypothetical protein
MPQKTQKSHAQTCVQGTGRATSTFMVHDANGFACAVNSAGTVVGELPFNGGDPQCFSGNRNGRRSILAHWQEVSGRQSEISQHGHSMNVEHICS